MPAKTAFSKERELEIASLYLGGKSTLALAKQFGIAPATVARILRDCGQPLRSRSESSALRANRCEGGSRQNGRYSVFQSKKNMRWIPAASSYEYIRMQQLEDDDQVISFERCMDRIPYTINGRNRHYTPDIVVFYADGSVVVEEIKPLPMTHKAEVMAKARAAEAFYLACGSQYQIVTEETIGRDVLATFEWSGIVGICQSELDEWQKQNTRRRATEWARKKRALNPKTAEQKAEHARRTREYQERWQQTATEEQKAARRKRAAAQTKKYRLGKKSKRSDETTEIQLGSVKTSTNA